MIPTRTELRTEGIVLRAIDYGESDRIVTFCTPDFGKIRGIAKGARRSSKRFANALEPFCCSRIHFSRRSPEALALIGGCDVVTHFPGIRADLEKTLAASCLIDLTDQFTPEEKAGGAPFRLLLDFLGLIETAELSEALLRYFEVRLLRISGYDPVLDRCVACGQAVTRESAYAFDAARGGLTCGRCTKTGGDAIPVSLGTVRTLTMARELEVGRLGRLLLSERSADESRRLLARFIRQLLGREPRSAHVLNEIRRMGI